ncbi:ATP-dependent RNA helicase DOB1, partial [Striga asiatica]
MLPLATGGAGNVRPASDIRLSLVACNSDSVLEQHVCTFETELSVEKSVRKSQVVYGQIIEFKNKAAALDLIGAEIINLHLTPHAHRLTPQILKPLFLFTGFIISSHHLIHKIIPDLLRAQHIDLVSGGKFQDFDPPHIPSTAALEVDHVRGRRRRVGQRMVGDGSLIRSDVKTGRYVQVPRGRFYRVGLVAFPVKRLLLSISNSGLEQIIQGDAGEGRHGFKRINGGILGFYFGFAAMEEVSVEAEISSQAFVILKTKEEADYVLSRLTNRSLVLSDG